MKISSATSIMMGLLGLLLIAAPQPAAAQTPGGGIALAPSVAPTTPPTAAGEVGTVIDGSEEVVDEVVVDILVAGTSDEQGDAIDALIAFLQKAPLTVGNSKVNATAVWDHTHSSGRKNKVPGRALRATDKAMASAKADSVDDDDVHTNHNSTRCTAVFDGEGNYSVVHITLQGNATKDLVDGVMIVLTNPNLPQQFFNNHHIPLVDFICKSNVRMQSEAPPANFAPMSDSAPKEGLSSGEKAGVAIGVIGGAAVVGAVGMFAFKSFGAAAATV